MDLGLTASFEDELYQARYQRNNKRGGLKNLRCFPTCAFRHKERGFCGRSVLLHTTLNRPYELISFGEFFKTESVPRLKVGDVCDLQWLVSIERSKALPTKPLVRGELIDDSSPSASPSFEYNRERRGWHYGWASNKHTCNSTHCFRAYVFVFDSSSPVDAGLDSGDPSNRLRVVGVYDSPSFMLFCRRRRRFNMTPTAPVAVPVKRKSSDASSKSKKRKKSTASSEKQHQQTKLKISHPLNFPDVDLSRFTMDSPAILATSCMPQIVVPIECRLDYDRVDAMMTRLSDLLHHRAHTSAESTQQQQQHSQPQQPTTEIFTDDFADLMVAFGANLNPGSGSSTPQQNTAAFPIATDDFLAGIDAAVGPNVEDVFRYLNRSVTFTESVRRLAREERLMEDYGSFLDVAKIHLEGFLVDKRLTVKDFDSILTGSTEPSQFLMNEWDLVAATVREDPPSNIAATVVDPPQVMFFTADDGTKIPNVSGKWKRTPESELEMSRLRKANGTPWVLSKLFEFMESKFEISQTPNEVKYIVERPFLKAVPMTFELDGNERPWGVRVPFFTSALSSSWTYRAWVENGAVVVAHTAGDRRVVRINWVDGANRSRLKSTVVLEEKDSSLESGYREIARSTTVATRRS